MRQPEGSPRDVMRGSFDEEKLCRHGATGFVGASPRAWQWKPGVLKVSDDNKYRALNLEEDEEDDRPVRICSEAQARWVDDWLESVESGELDVYTCLGLSNTFTWSPDTRKLIFKVLAVTVLQVVIPLIMLSLETADGLTFQPATSNSGFRIIGSALYLYSVYSMYNNALDECRGRLLNFAFRHQLPAGYWVPLVLGEFSNVLVSMVLVLTLYVIFTHLVQPADLILNAVAVNFLGSVDGEFVNEDMKKDALANFKEVTSAVLENPELNHHGVGMSQQDDEEKLTCLDVFLKTLLYSIAVSGIIMSMVFFFASTSEEFNSVGPSGKGHSMGRCDCCHQCQKRP